MHVIGERSCPLGVQMAHHREHSTPADPPGERSPPEVIGHARGRPRLHRPRLIRALLVPGPLRPVGCRGGCHARPRSGTLGRGRGVHARLGRKLQPRKQRHLMERRRRQFRPLGRGRSCFTRPARHRVKVFSFPFLYLLLQVTSKDMYALHCWQRPHPRLYPLS